MSKSKLSDFSSATIIASVFALVVVTVILTVLAVNYLPLADRSAGRQAGQLTHDARAKAAAKTPIVVTGFRSASFGDDEATVRQAINKDFGVADDKIIVGKSDTEKTKLLAIRVKDVVPDSGIAEIVYIFGYESKQLIQVNVVMGSQLSPDIEPIKIATAANILGNYLADQGFDPETVSVNQKIGPNAVRVFTGRDLEGHLVTLLFQEGQVKQADVAEAATPDSKDKNTKEKAKESSAVKAEPAAKRFAILRLSYVADPVNPDIFKIEKGEF
tara:strand:- start:203568 stop:204383 length:816 start_codon:yes stop_codon:yes gene_type:complete